eukprot:scaffold30471_cov21-Tisochrysis_lutea.AAC.3
MHRCAHLLVASVGLSVGDAERTVAGRVSMKSAAAGNCAGREACGNSSPAFREMGALDSSLYRGPEAACRGARGERQTGA